MTYTSVELLRKQLADPFRYCFDSQTGDGETTVFKLSHDKIQLGTYQVYVDSVLKTEVSDYSIDKELGLLIFILAPDETKLVEIKFYFAAFSDVELTEFLALEINNVDSAMIRCIDILLMDSARRFDYASGQTEIKASQVFKNLQELRKVFESKVSINLKSVTGGMKIINRLDSHYKDEVATEVDLSRMDL